MIAIIQANLGGGSGAQNLILQTAAERGTDVLIISEYYKYGRMHQSWHCDQSRRVAIAPISNIPIDEIGTESDGFIWVTIGGVRVYSCYLSPNTSYSEYEDFIQRLEMSIRTSLVPVLVGGDFNAKHGLWSSPKNDRKGEALADMVEALNLVLCNSGTSLTREKDGY